MSLKKILNLKYILKITRENKEKQLFSFNAILLKFILSSSFFFKKSLRSENVQKLTVFISLVVVAGLIYKTYHSRPRPVP